MNSPPDVSVVMSVYNGADSLQATIDSILLQEGVSFEFIIVNDGSCDGTGRLLSDYASRDSRIHVITQENAGLTRALITGCNFASAPFIARIDCGDRARAGRLRKQFQFLRNNHDCVFVSCWTEVLCGELLLSVQKGSGVADRPIRILDRSAEWGTVDGPSHHSSVMFRKDAYIAVGGYRPAFYYGQDWDLWFRLGEQGLFFMLPEVLCECEASAFSISNSARAAQNLYADQSRRALFLRLDGQSDQEAVDAAAQIERRSLSKFEKRRNRSRGHYFIGRSLLARGEMSGRDHLLEAARLNPLFLRSWLAIALSFFPHFSIRRDWR